MGKNRALGKKLLLSVVAVLMMGIGLLSACTATTKKGDQIVTLPEKPPIDADAKSDMHTATFALG